MELIISASKRKKESDSAIKIGKRYLNKGNKKVQDKVNGKEAKAKNKTAKSIALAKENQRYRDQVKAVRAKYKASLTAELEKLSKQHKKKLESIRKGVSGKAPAKPTTKPALPQPK